MSLESSPSIEQYPSNGRRSDGQRSAPMGCGTSEPVTTELRPAGIMEQGRRGKGLDEVGRACQNIPPNHAVSRYARKE